MYAEDELLPISCLQHLLFCERRAMMVLIEGIWDENLFTVEGHHLHERSDEPQAETRGDIRIARGLRIRSLKLGLAGKADVVEFHGHDTAYPVEYKRGQLRHEEGYEIQLCAQALCLEEMLSINVPEGAIFYGKPKRRLNITFNENLRMKTVEAAARLHALAKEGRTPRAKYEKKCRNCSLIESCLPKACGGRKDVEQYLESALEETSGP
jgi:CRISPR-associated exonuclease Cas4